RITDEDYEDSVVNLDENGAPVEKSRRLKIEPVAYYFSALNLKNAIRQARRQGLPIPAIDGCPNGRCRRSDGNLASPVTERPVESGRLHAHGQNRENRTTVG